MFLAQNLSAIRLCKLESKQSISLFRAAHGGPCSERRRQVKRNNNNNNVNYSNTMETIKNEPSKSTTQLQIISRTPDYMPAIIRAKASVTNYINKIVDAVKNKKKHQAQKLRNSIRKTKNLYIDPYMEYGVFETDDHMNTFNRMKLNDNGANFDYGLDDLSPMLMLAPSSKDIDRHNKYIDRTQFKGIKSKEILLYDGVLKKRPVAHFMKDDRYSSSERRADRIILNGENIRFARDNKARMIRQLMGLKKVYNRPIEMRK